MPHFHNSPSLHETLFCVLLRYEPRLSSIKVDMLPQTIPDEQRDAIDAKLEGIGLAAGL